MKTRIAALFFLSCFAVASLPARASSLQTRNKAVARRVFDEIFNQGKFQVADEIYAKDFVNHGVQRDVGLKEDQDAARGWKLAFPDLKMTVVKEIAEGDLVTVLYTGTGTNTGEGNGLPATGKKVQARGITIWRIVNGKIVEEWSEFDQLRIMQELGLIHESK
ncbi:MAG TPA: ester cyclase [Terriglobales bacterium]|nr:ester cyclase [Terriglobales bacterium]